MSSAGTHSPFRRQDDVGVGVEKVDLVVRRLGHPASPSPSFAVPKIVSTTGRPTLLFSSSVSSMSGRWYTRLVPGGGGSRWGMSASGPLHRSWRYHGGERRFLCVAGQVHRLVLMKRDRDNGGKKWGHSGTSGFTPPKHVDKRRVEPRE